MRHSATPSTLTGPTPATPAVTRGRAARRVVGLALVAAVVAMGCSGGDGEEDAGTDTGGSSTPAEVAAADVVLGVGDEVVAELDPRYQSYNVEMVEVTGGEFWQPYDAGEGRVARPPIDLSSERLRNLAAELGPAYIRVSGSWANSTYFDAEGTSGGTPPDGYIGVLTPEQWQGVGDFAEAVDGEVVTSFASSTGARDAAGVWQPDRARALLEFSLDNDIPLGAVEFLNEPSLPVGVPAGYDAAAYARDFAIFDDLLDEVAPDLRVVGPGAVDDVTPIVLEPSIAATDMLDATAGSLDVFGYHFYPKVSERCGSVEGPEIALTQDYLSRVEVDQQYYEGLRDTYLPDAPMWVGETAQAACGGDRWAAQYLDMIRYVDTLGRLADGDGDVVFHNTLAASDYGLIDEDGFEPRPNYWAAVLWQRLMGTEVLATDAGGDVDDLGVYSHCTADGSGSATYAVVNSSATEARTVATPSGEATVYLLTADDLAGSTVELNGEVLEAGEDGTLPALDGRTASGAVEVPAASVAFIVDEGESPACT
jgi:hypothetical protein